MEGFPYERKARMKYFAQALTVLLLSARGAVKGAINGRSTHRTADLHINQRVGQGDRVKKQVTIGV